MPATAIGGREEAKNSHQAAAAATTLYLGGGGARATATASAANPSSAHHQPGAEEKDGPPRKNSTGKQLRKKTLLVEFEAWKEKLLNTIPRPLHSIFTSGFLSLVEPRDNDDEIIRKFVVFIGSFATLFSSVPFAIYYAYLASREEYASSRPALVIASATCFVGMSVFNLCYLYLRWTRSVSNAIFSAVLIWSVFYSVLMSISVPHFPAWICVFIVVEAAVILRSEYFGTLIALGTISFFICFYNAAMINIVCGWTLLTVPTPHQGSAGEILALTLMGFFLALVGAFVLQQHYMQYARAMDNSATTTQMGWRLAGHLRHWDFARADKTLQLYSSAPHCDTQVLAHFSGIVQTVKGFGPYLPRDVLADMHQQQLLQQRRGSGGGVGSSSGGCSTLHNCPLVTTHVVVMCVELANFLVLYDAVSVDDLGKLVRLFHATVATVVRQHGGVVARLTDSTVTCMWNAPLANPRAACAALLAAMHLLALAERELRPQFAECGAGAEGALCLLRCGISSGPALVGQLGSVERGAYSVNGPMVHVAVAGLLRAARSIRSASTIFVTEQALIEAQEKLPAFLLVASSSKKGAAAAAAASGATYSPNQSQTNNLTSNNNSLFSVFGTAPGVKFLAREAILARVEPSCPKLIKFYQLLGMTDDALLSLPSATNTLAVDNNGNDDSGGSVDGTLAARNNNSAARSSSTLFTAVYPGAALVGRSFVAGVCTHAVTIVDKMSSAVRNLYQQNWDAAVADYDELAHTFASDNNDEAWPALMQRQGVDRALLQKAAKFAAELRADPPSDPDALILVLNEE